ncbi:MAG: M28 family peptidase [Anaerolineaceae bacterium]|nr:M28 family peptidase [Anaerolineaceae bacterium]
MSEPVSNHPQVKQWLSHIHALAVDIGPRGSTTPAERQAAEYAKDQFRQIGLTPIWQDFQSARSIFLPHIIGSFFMIFAFILYPLGGRLIAAIAAIISILVIVSELQELGFQNNLLRMLVPKGSSQNVHAVVPPSAEHKQDIILVGHLDTQRTPLFFRTPKYVKIYDKFTTIIFVTYLIQTILYSLSVFLFWPWVWYASIPTAMCAVLMISFFIEAEFSPFTAGANDNASAAGMVLTMAEELHKNPLKHTRVFAVCTGCEETQHYGMIAWYQQNLQLLKKPKAIVFELLGVAGPGYLTQEGIIVPFKADQNLIKMVENLNLEHPEWGAYPVKISGGNSEMADALRNKIPAISLFGMKKDGEAPYWHQLEDTYDKMNPQVMEDVWSLTMAMLQKIDQNP